MAVDSVENGLYQWTGPNDFEFTGLVVDLGESELNDSGLYVVQGYDGECPIQNDTIEVVVHNPLPALCCRMILSHVRGSPSRLEPMWTM